MVDLMPSFFIHDHILAPLVEEVTTMLTTAVRVVAAVDPGVCPHLC